MSSNTGRPRRGRALTEILQAAGEREMSATIGQSVVTMQRKKVLAELVWQAVTEGTVFLPNGREINLSGRDMLDMMKWIFTHVDGPYRDDEPVVSDVIELDIAKLTPEARAARLEQILGTHEHRSNNTEKS